MTVNTRRFACAPEHVFDVLADGWLFPLWVVGAARMRYVDPQWPSPASELHHSVGAWPVMLDDDTTMLEWHPPRRAVFRARGWPLGEALVTVEAKPRADGCVVRMTETPSAGPARAARSVLRPLLHARNAETLRRLALTAEGRAEPGQP